MIYFTSLGIALLAVGCIAWVRVKAKRASYHAPEIPPPRQVPDSTRLHRMLRSWRASQDSQCSSLCFPLSNARESLLSRIRLTQLADVMIDAQYYVLKNDDSGRAMLAALVAAARRGVRVRLLIDDIDLKGYDALLSRLSRDVEGLEIRIFNPIWLRFARPLDYMLRFPRSSRRMHNKSFTADATACIVGGRNIADEYFGVDSEVAFTDYDMFAAGQVTPDVVGQFDNYWHSGIAVECAQVAAPADDRPYLAWLAQVEAAGRLIKDESASEEDLAIEQWAVNSLPAYPCHATVLFDPPEKVLGRLFDTDGSLAPKIMDLMLSARESLLICSPYFIPSESGLSLFRQLRNRGVEISVLTNSFAANDVLVVHAGYIDYRKQMVELGVRMYEFKPGRVGDRHLKLLGSKRSSLHAKAFIIDRERLFVGSFNLDPRSAIHNTEMGIVFDNADFASNLHVSLTDRLDEIAYHLTLNEHDRLRWEERTGQTSLVLHDSEPNTSSLQRLGVYLLSWLPVEWLL